MGSGMENVSHSTTFVCFSSIEFKIITSSSSSSSFLQFSLLHHHHLLLLLPPPLYLFPLFPHHRNYHALNQLHHHLPSQKKKKNKWKNKQKHVLNFTYLSSLF